MKTPRAVAFGLALLMGAIPAAAFGRSGPAPVRADRDVEDCEETRPDTFALKGVTDDGADVSLDVLALLDGVDRAAAKAVFDTAAQAYAPIGIKLVPRFRTVVFAADEVTPAGDQYAQPQNLIDDAKALLGPFRPKGIDVVFTLTTKDLGSSVDPAVTGYADCIGGIRYPDRSFAVGEMRENPLSVGVNIYADAPAKVLAHEMGHLLGAHHEHQSCVEGITADDANERELTPCTVMTNYVELQSLNFGTLEGVVVRGHATRYAQP
ncbi:MAG: hypothetical protein QOG54_1012 [Actinomycetota bacterium]|jgi:hypothetical protein|nr:hypothetical protein [Actinomycetota bacterium]